ncbi:hypothetical protein [Azotobacter beijerinckii]|uniref:hypothetical protein n=1 Tax=Azotobacter beijerinckii TaxID=170623 RepID=UPI001C31A652|nr:hypothetical protein [Azotobacter beijerinckii]
MRALLAVDGALMIGNRMAAVRPFHATFWLERKHEKQKAAGGTGRLFRGDEWEEVPEVCRVLRTDN